MLSIMTHNQPIVKDSFDITSLYTNIPFDETIEIILDYFYNDDMPPPMTEKDDLEKLFSICNEKSPFSIRW